jgi:hypothetical protein
VAVARQIELSHLFLAASRVLSDEPEELLLFSNNAHTSTIKVFSSYSSSRPEHSKNADDEGQSLGRGDIEGLNVPGRQRPQDANKHWTSLIAEKEAQDLLLKTWMP